MSETHDDQPALEDATPVRIYGPIELKPKVTIEVGARVISPKGLEMTVGIHGIAFDAPEGAALRALALEKALLDKGFRVLPAPSAPASAPSGSPAAGASGEATWIKGEGGAPPRCSIHGAGKYVEGVYKADHAKAGQSYAFWSCNNRQCKPKGAPV